MTDIRQWPAGTMWPWKKDLAMQLVAFFSSSFASLRSFDLFKYKRKEPLLLRRQQLLPNHGQKRDKLVVCFDAGQILHTHRGHRVQPAATNLEDSVVIVRLWSPTGWLLPCWLLGRRHVDGVGSTMNRTQSTPTSALSGYFPNDHRDNPLLHKLK